jgi:exodeoxyribonuclease VII small subunit
MALFERGLHLSQHNQEKLKSAEQQINILLEKNGQSQLSPFNTDETISSD